MKNFRDFKKSREWQAVKVRERRLFQVSIILILKFFIDIM